MTGWSPRSDSARPALPGLALLLAMQVLYGQESPAAPFPAASERAEQQYVLGPDDQLEIWALGADEVSGRPVRVDNAGNLTIPLLGRIKAGGLTPEELELTLRKRLKTYVREPLVSVTVTEFQSRPVSVLGALQNPGVFQVKHRKTLVEILSEAGGLREDAGGTVRLTRRLEWGDLPLADARVDGSGQFASVDIGLEDLLNGRTPQRNLYVHPHDVISVPTADRVFVIGAVQRPGGFLIRSKETMSVLKAISLAEGLRDEWGSKGTRILRRQAGHEEPVEIALDLKHILTGQRPDVPLQPEDIVFVPLSNTKMIASFSARTVLQAVASAFIYNTMR